MLEKRKTRLTDLDVIAIVASVAILGVSLWVFISTGGFPALLGLLLK